MQNAKEQTKKDFKVVGIPGYLSDTSFGAGKTYLHFIETLSDHLGEQFRARIIMPWEEYASDIDLLLLTGGLDTAPANYGAYPSFYTSNQDVFKEFFFKERLKNYVGKVPIFGICLGMQMLNIYFDGGLEQHLQYHPQSPDRRKEGHKIVWCTYDSKKEKNIFWTSPVNSHHHQGVLGKQVSPDMDVIAVEDITRTSSKDSVVEAILHKNLPIAGVQYHPEEWAVSLTNSLLRYILGKTSNRPASFIFDDK